MPAEELDDAVAGYLGALVRGGPGALAGAKALLRGRANGSLRAELADLAEVSVGYFLSAEGREGVSAFREKREPSWVPGG